MRRRKPPRRWILYIVAGFVAVVMVVETWFLVTQTRGNQAAHEKIALLEGTLKSVEVENGRLKTENEEGMTQLRLSHEKAIALMLSTQDALKEEAKAAFSLSSPDDGTGCKTKRCREFVDFIRQMDRSVEVSDTASLETLGMENVSDECKEFLAKSADGTGFLSQYGQDWSIYYNFFVPLKHEVNIDVSPPLFMLGLFRLQAPNEKHIKIRHIGHCPISRVSERHLEPDGRPDGLDCNDVDTEVIEWEVSNRRILLFLDVQREEVDVVHAVFSKDRIKRRAPNGNRIFRRTIEHHLNLVLMDDPFVGPVHRLLFI